MEEILMDEERPAQPTLSEPSKQDSQPVLRCRSKWVARLMGEAPDRHRRLSIPILEQMERRTIPQAMAQREGDKIEAAPLLSTGNSTLCPKLRQHNSDSR